MLLLCFYHILLRLLDPLPERLPCMEVFVIRSGLNGAETAIQRPNSNGKSQYLFLSTTVCRTEVTFLRP